MNVKKLLGWGRRVVATVAVILALSLGGCGYLFDGPISDEDLSMVEQARTSVEVKTAAVDPIEQYKAAVDDLDTVTLGIEAGSITATRSDILVLEQAGINARMARHEVFRTARAVPPNKMAADGAVADLRMETRFLERQLELFARKMGG